MDHYLAIDIGASSGRHIVGYKENGELHTEEVYRFPNCIKKTKRTSCMEYREAFR